MNKKILFSIIFFIVILHINAQLYTPNGVIQGATGNSYVGIGTAVPAVILHINNAGITGQLDYN